MAEDPRPYRFSLGSQMGVGIALLVIGLLLGLLDTSGGVLRLLGWAAAVVGFVVALIALARIINRR